MTAFDIPTLCHHEQREAVGGCRLRVRYCDEVKKNSVSFFVQYSS